MINRRRSLESGFSAAAVASISAALSSCSGTNGSPGPKSQLDQLRSVIHGRVIAPSDAAYAVASQPWNAPFANVLSSAVVVADANDVAQTIKFAREHKMSFAMRNGRPRSRTSYHSGETALRVKTARSSG